ncbi:MULTISPECIES: Omp28 family outer membrane lipoprotein [unclassified Lentimicrobium]|uniref:Omp28 family outer membrane lipoprotein n=1 Tax=unclassified Lentimicrobium TaxID=2677434 RepID=UPI001551E157|nr:MULTISPECIES: Omp28 family outer membrane lipoprotein [unclassified Lentimicrobium]NPD47720.1 Omp28 family outer membrane lipoprotein [Lentimicrobium sp. S6]NPD83867.1 Omp28 family outer membrane lipoprotein [Lentimicrobium sp. L6]
MKVLKIFLALTIIGFSFAACDKIEAPYTQEVEKPVGNKKVLLEDFTGQKCVNCPLAHEIAHTLQDTSNYGEKLIVVAIHAGFFATPSAAPFDYDFRTEAGDIYESYFSVQTYPTGMVNRVNTDGNYLIDKDGWATEVAKQFEETSLVNIEITPSLNGNKLSGEVNLDFIEGFASQGNVQIWITEDSIIKPQVVPGGMEEDYVHMHVLRGAINGNWGEALPSASYNSGDNESISFSNFQLGDDWVTDKLSLVVYLYEQESKKVIQVEEIKIN